MGSTETLQSPKDDFSIKEIKKNIPKDIKQGDTVNFTIKITKTPDGCGIIIHYTDISVTRSQK